MVTVGLGESLAIASIALQLVEIAQKCAEWTERYSAFGEVASGFHVRYNHEVRKMQALQHVLLDPEKFNLGKPLIELMEKERQNNIRDMLLCTLREVQSFEALASKYRTGEVEEKEKNADRQGAINVTKTALDEALLDFIERQRFVQIKVTWIKKAIWASTGKKAAERTLSQIHTWLELVRDEIDQFFWTFKIPENTKKETVDKLKSLAGDVDLAALTLGKPMRMRQLVLQMELPPHEIDDTFPESMMIEAIRIEPGNQLQPGRWLASLDGSPALTESRTYTVDTFWHVLKGMQSLCSLLALDKDERFRLPKAEGLYHDEDEKRIHLVIMSSSLDAVDATHIWSLNRSIVEVPKRNIPPLEVRMRLALDISVAVAKLHSVGWLHQGIQSRNIGVAVDPINRPLYAHPFLLGFSKSRPIGGSSVTDNDPLNNLYRHPDRWQPASSMPHTALHDLYSLGITLLEIGLWKVTTDMLVVTRPGRKFDVKNWENGSQVQGVLLQWTSQLGFITGSNYQKIVKVLLTAEKEDSESREWQKSTSDRRVLHVIAALSEICETWMMREVLQKRQRILGDEHPDTISAMGNLANTLSDQGKRDEAELMKREVLERMQRILGDDHPDTIWVMSNLASMLSDQGKLDEEALMGKEALEKRQRILGEEHPDPARAVEYLRLIPSAPSAGPSDTSTIKKQPFLKRVTGKLRQVGDSFRSHQN